MPTSASGRIASCPLRKIFGFERFQDQVCRRGVSGKSGPDPIFCNPRKFGSGPDFLKTPLLHTWPRHWLYTDDMNHVSPVFTDYEQQVIRELAVHRVQPNAVHRLLEGAGRPVAKLLNIGRHSNSRALRGLADHVHGWIEEGLIKTFRVANKLANTKDISKRYAVRGINVGNDFESLRYMPLSQLDAVADSFRFSSSLLLGVEGA